MKIGESVSSKEAVVGIDGDDTEGFGEGFGARIGFVGLPASAGSLPEDTPDFAGADESEFGNGVFDGFGGTAGEGADEEEVDGVAGNALAFANFVAEVEGRALGGPKVVFEGAGMPGNFARGESHFLEGAGRGVVLGGGGGEGGDHAVEDEVVEGEHGVPVEAAEEAARAEGGGLDEVVAVVAGDDFEFQPGFAGEAHLGEEEEAAGGGVGDEDAPEVEGVARLDVVEPGAAAVEADAADEFVEEATEGPEPVGVVPAGAAADAPDAVPCGLGVAVDVAGVDVLEAAVAGDVDGVDEGGAGAGGGEGVAPSADDVALLDFFQGDADGVTVGEEGDAELGGEVVWACDDVDFHAVNEVDGEGVGGGGDEVEPVGGEAGCHDGDGEDEAPQAADGGVLGEHVAVGEELGAGDVEVAVEGGVAEHDADEELDDVADGDGLAACLQPGGGDHEGELLDEVADDLEGGAAGADDDAGAKHGDGDGAGAQDVLDGEA